jgi:hypothetical protein
MSPWLALVLVVLPTVAQAQWRQPPAAPPPDLSFDRASLPFGLSDGVSYEEELDGRPDTREFLQVISGDGTALRGYAIRNGEWCVGPWINPAHYATGYPGDEFFVYFLRMIQGKLKLVIIGNLRLYRTVPIPYGCEEETR